jgi:hypothetical protein
MPQSKLSFTSRLVLALVAFWRVLADSDFAAGVSRLQHGAESSTEPEQPTPPEPVPPAPRLLETDTSSALQLLGLLQQEGRFVDFLQEDVSGYSDADIGGAARVVHEGCSRALREHLQVTPVREEDEGVRITLAPGFDAAEVRLTGNVVGKPPFNGTLVHKGWRVAECRLPRLVEGHDVRVLAQAEVEL